MLRVVRQCNVYLQETCPIGFPGALQDRLAAGILDNEVE